MSNNRLWKRRLQELVDAHNRDHGRKPKGVSHKTMHERAASLFRAFALLRRLGHAIDPTNLAGRHVALLVDYWTGNARLAELCRARGVAMLDHPHSAAYIQQQLSFLRVYANAWIGKPGMVRPLEAYVGADPRFRRSHAADRDRSWDGNAVDFATLVDRVAAVDARVAAPIRGGGSFVDPEVLTGALTEIARQLGHNRASITRAYLGSPPSSQGPGDPIGKEDLA